MRNATTPSQVLVLILALFILMEPGQTIAGPDKISYQGKATDAAGNPLPDGDYDFVFQLYEYPTAGDEQWLEIATVHTTGGLFTHLLGSINPIPVWLFSTYDSLFLDMWIGSQHLSPRIPITSAGYALSVNSIDNALGGTIYGNLYVRHEASAPVGARLVTGEEGVGTLQLNKGIGDVGISLSPDLLGSLAVMLPVGAIQATEILDEPGVGSDNNTDITLTGGVQYLAGRTMTAPVDGYVLVIATAHATIQHSYGTQSTCVLDISDDITSFINSTIARITLPSLMPSGIYEFPMSSHALFPIPAGSQAYYALGSKAGAVNVTFYDVQLSECFFPTAYTTVSQPVPSSGSAIEEAASFELEVERLQAVAFNNARIQAELDKVKAEMAAMKQEVEDLKGVAEPKR